MWGKWGLQTHWRAPEEPLRSEETETGLQSSLRNTGNLLAHVTKLWRGLNDPETQKTMLPLPHFSSWSFSLSFFLGVPRALGWHPLLAHEPKVKNKPTNSQPDSLPGQCSSLYSQIIKWKMYGKLDNGGFGLVTSPEPADSARHYLRFVEMR